MPEGLLDRLQGGGAAAELFEASSDTLEVSFSAGEVKGALARETSGLGLRAQRGGRAGFVCSRDLSPEGLAALERNVESSLEVGDPAAFEFPAASAPEVAAEALELFDPATAALGAGELVGVGKAALDELRAAFPGVTFDATVRRSIGRTSLRNTAGLEVEHRYTVFSCSVEANRTRDEDVLLDWASAASTSQERADPARVVRELRRRLEWSRETVDWRPGRMPVLFTPSGGLVVWSPLLQALSGKTVMLGTSPLRARLGEQIVSPQVTLLDDGLRVGALGSAPSDDEGVPRRRRALIEAGALRGFVHDLETAAATGSEPTGNGERAGATARPEPGFSNVVVEGGARGWEEMLAGIDYGVLVHRVVGMGQGNTLPGNFTNPFDLAFLIEGGQVKGRIKDGSIAGNVYELLGEGRLSGLSREVEPVGGSTWLPWLQLADLNVVGKG
ncbi:MAG: TldD/PmbA family protein [Planctomycetota bacterium]